MAEFAYSMLYMVNCYVLKCTKAILKFNYCLIQANNEKIIDTKLPFEHNLFWDCS